MGIADDGRYYEGSVATDQGDDTTTIDALASSTNGTAFDVQDAAALVATLDVTTADGTTPTLDVKLQGRVNADAPWTDLGSFAQVTSVSDTARAFTTLGYDEARWVFTVGGTTPSFDGTIAVDKIRN